MLIRRCQRGFSMIETMVVIVIVAILASIAAPSFRTLLANYQVRTGAEAVLAGLQLARTEAIRRNVRVRITLGNGSGWTVLTDDGLTTIQTRDKGEGSSQATVTTTPSTATTVTFNGSGRRVANADTTSPIDDLTIQHAKASQTLKIFITSGGSIRMCDSGISSNTDPRKC